MGFLSLSACDSGEVFLIQIGRTEWIQSQANVLSMTFKELGRLPIIDGERRHNGQSCLIPDGSWEIILLDSKDPFVQGFIPSLAL